MTRPKWGGRRAARARARLAPSVAAGKATCWRCGLPILPGQDWDTGHLADLARGGPIDGPTRPEHARRVDCPEGGNRHHGALLSAELRGGPPVEPRRSRRLAEWLGFFLRPNHARNASPRFFSPHPPSVSTPHRAGTANLSAPLRITP